METFASVLASKDFSLTMTVRPELSTGSWFPNLHLPVDPGAAGVSSFLSLIPDASEFMLLRVSDGLKVRELQLPGCRDYIATIPPMRVLTLTVRRVTQGREISLFCDGRLQGTVVADGIMRDIINPNYHYVTVGSPREYISSFCSSHFSIPQ